MSGLKFCDVNVNVCRHVFRQATDLYLAHAVIKDAVVALDADALPNEVYANKEGGLLVQGHFLEIHVKDVAVDRVNLTLLVEDKLGAVVLELEVKESEAAVNILEQLHQFLLIYRKGGGFACLVNDGRQ